MPPATASPMPSGNCGSFVKRTATSGAEEISLLMGESLAGAGDIEAAGAEFEAAYNRFGSFQCLAQYAIWAANSGDPALADRILAAGDFETSMSEYAPSDYRRLVAAASDRYGVGTDEILVGAGADEILDIIGKAYLREGDAGFRAERRASRHHRRAAQPRPGLAA